MASAESPSYIDYSSILATDFSPYSFANGLVTATNNPTDTPLDLSTPLSRVLFDVQEIDTHIHNLTSSSAIPLLEHTQRQTKAAGTILKEVDTQLVALNRGYQRLEEEVLKRWQEAEKTRIAATKSWEVLRLTRAVSRCLALARQLQAQLEELGSRTPTLSRTDDHKALVRAAYTLLAFRELFDVSQSGPDGDIGLQKVNIVRTIRVDLITPAETALVGKSQQIIREFSMSSLTAPASQQGVTFSQTADAKSRITSAIYSLYLLSPNSPTTSGDANLSLLLFALQTYLQTALTSSTASIARALATLPSLDRTLLEVSARCQNILVLETLLKSIPVPSNPSLTSSSSSGRPPKDFLAPLLSALDSPPSLPSYFWRSLASSLPSRVQDILRKGGVSARTLRSNKEKIREDLRECVLRGSRLPSNVQPSEILEKQATPARGQQHQGPGQVVLGSWEREAAVMVGSVVGSLGR
ncbi:putative golgi transport complex component [Phaeomoniella chlamydospora]|uniref:Conserved oligomeric Golgi complex subunit 5 n=1 Tax=Phaeomoniella chlamydospora TaxID=158046 RepID=A0A0G2EKA3_PHACM|nr:putative golgi transport complex component [Phaeomoniella chlamydospora]